MDKMIYVNIEHDLYLVNDEDYNNLIDCKCNCYGSFNYDTAYELNKAIQHIKDNYIKIENFEWEFFSPIDIDEKKREIIKTELPF